MIGPDVIIEPNVIIASNVSIAKKCHIKSFCYLEACSIGENNIIGPFARIRPDTVTDKNVKLGNFVEVKKSSIGKGTKISHLSYIGDTLIGENANIGAGTITCNFDGYKKYKTKIGSGSFIGSNSFSSTIKHWEKHNYRGWFHNYRKHSQRQLKPIKSETGNKGGWS